MQGTIKELQNKRASDGFIVEVGQKADANTLIKVFDDFQYTEKNTLIFHGSENRFFEATYRMESRPGFIP